MKDYLIFLLCISCYITNAQEPVTKQATQKQKLVLEKDGKDPVCGMKVKKGTTLVSTYKEKPYGFCSKVCKERFDKEPEKYVKK
ncbi:YHS domain-containing protein [Emticicia agri]|uniref:YHS domain-containing protein n=1 Tax=Emticicia agri TaxID=2492393 RepID=A0A4Q5LXF8_9BACT|nr:YHS domain-containing protein [Emticicia agri]RYU94511.1 YHS domain-containing protein [Emticicia agri]